MATVLGINSAYHESAAALLVDGRCVAAIEEERFTGIKHAKRARVDNPDHLPVNAIRWCLAQGGVQLADVDAVAYAFRPGLRAANVGLDEKLGAEGWGTPAGERIFEERLRAIPAMLSEIAGRDLGDRFHWVEHHVAHASSAFLASPYESAAVMTLDGIGEIETAWLGYGSGGGLVPVREIRYPNSLGLLWEKVSLFLGFDRYAAGTTMGLAAWGDPVRYRDAMARLVQAEEGGFRVEPGIAQLRADSFDGFERLFGLPRRMPGEPLAQEHMDIAAALQEVTERIGIALARWLGARTGARHLCLAGGVVLNCRMNEAIAREELLESVFIQPAAHDAGTALGAALWVWSVLWGEQRVWHMEHAYLGPEFTSREIEAALDQYRGRLKWTLVRNPEQVAVEQLLEGRIVGWFGGALEFGPRALGNRSILCDPRGADLARRVNERIKRREWFRPLAGSFLEEEAAGHLDLAGPHPAYAYMTMTAGVLARDLLPGVTHRDGTSRPQLVGPNAPTALRRVLELFHEATGVPALLNTSLNLKGWPLAGTPSHALRCLLESELDCLVMPPYVVERA